jgi:hypothetical protein
MFKKEFIAQIIQEEISNRSLIEPALYIFDQLLIHRDQPNTFTVFELSNLTSRYALKNEDLYKIGFELASLSLPVFLIIVKYEDNYGVEAIFEEKEEIEHIFFKETIALPGSGEILSYLDYKDDILMLFKSNDELLNQIAPIND